MESILSDPPAAPRTVAQRAHHDHHRAELRECPGKLQHRGFPKCTEQSSEVGKLVTPGVENAPNKAQRSESLQPRGSKMHLANPMHWMRT